MILKKQFREDLYYRLNTAYTQLPSLKERRSDIDLLIDYFLDEMSVPGTKKKTVSEEVYHLLKNYSWPGNVRELKGVLNYACAIGDFQEIRMEDLPPFLFLEKSSADKSPVFPESQFKTLPKSGLFNSVIEKAEISVIEMAIKKSKNMTEAIRLLGVSRRTFYNKIKKYRLDSLPKIENSGLN